MSTVILALVAASAVLVAVPRGTAAGPPTDQLRGRVERVLKVLDDPELRKAAKAAERRRAIREIAGEVFDFNEISRRSLGRHWQGRTPQEREEFVGAFGDLLERSYASRIELYSGEKIAFVGEALDGDLATVRTRIVTKEGIEVPLDYRMFRQGDRWRAYDVSIEGVSLIANYRSQFNAVIQRSSFQALVKAIKAKQSEPSGPKRRERRPEEAVAGAPAPELPTRAGPRQKP